MVNVVVVLAEKFLQKPKKDKHPSCSLTNNKNVLNIGYHLHVPLIVILWVL